MVEQAQGEKRKKPPSFPHVHPSRARKFKRAWVEKAKIRSKWNAQKKKEGFMERAKLEIPPWYDLEERDEPDEITRSKTPDDSGKPIQEEAAKTTHRAPSKQSEDTSCMPKNADKPDEEDVRELMRKAYSKSNLHTFKSDPLRKHTTSGKPNGGKGKGQPDMKLRMNALLAKIKRDYA